MRNATCPVFGNSAAILACLCLFAAPAMATPSDPESVQGKPVKAGAH